MSRDIRKDVSRRDLSELSSLARLTMSSKSVALKMGTHLVNSQISASTATGLYSPKRVALLSDLNKAFLILAYQGSCLKILCLVYLMISLAPI